jgi:hypothetical protein
MGKRKESGTEEEVIIGIRDLNYIDSSKFIHKDSK